MKVPKDLGLKIGTKEEANWTSILNQSEALLIKGKSDVVINEMIVKLAKKRIEQEKEKFK